MGLRKRVFIGSSSEELSLAQQAKAMLETDYDVTIWNETIWDKSVFKLNSNFLSDLLKAGLLFDYGILLGTSDDKVNYRGMEVLSPRDNVIFELGLFLGRLGISKCVFVLEKGLKIPTDLQGITLAVFDKTDKSSFEDAISKVSELFSHKPVAEINFFPSSTLASVYYENFIFPLCTHIIQNGGIDLDGVKYSNCMIAVNIPEKINTDVNLQFQRLKAKYNSIDKTINYSGRPRNFSVNIISKDNEIEILDFPTVISGINYAIQNLLPIDYSQLTNDHDIILERELNNFCDTLKLLIKRGGMDDLVKLVK